MGFYALGGRESDRRLQKLIKTYIETDVNRRREYLKTFASGKHTIDFVVQWLRSMSYQNFRIKFIFVVAVEKAMHQLPHILPDYMLVFAVPVLTHDPTFTAVDDPVQLKQIEKCIWLILEPLITNKEFFCYGFYKNLCERMKNHKDAFKPDDEITNQVCFNCFSIHPIAF